MAPARAWKSMGARCRWRTPATPGSRAPTSPRPRTGTRAARAPPAWRAMARLARKSIRATPRTTPARSSPTTTSPSDARTWQPRRMGSCATTAPSASRAMGSARRTGAWGASLPRLAPPPHASPAPRARTRPRPGLATYAGPAPMDSKVMHGRPAQISSSAQQNPGRAGRRGISPRSALRPTAATSAGRAPRASEGTATLDASSSRSAIMRTEAAGSPSSIQPYCPSALMVKATRTPHVACVPARASRGTVTRGAERSMAARRRHASTMPRRASQSSARTSRLNATWPTPRLSRQISSQAARWGRHLPHRSSAPAAPRATRAPARPPRALGRAAARSAPSR
mmetsp:Transcript_38816/g.123361  ORF Transcript_38816/g.123361 Transcript_38816/m.123361 type:complete len:341 (-) Transcript_38816:2455-3477(-)